MSQATKPYRKSLWRRGVNAVVRPLARAGLTGPRTHLLTVPGRRSGRPWSTPVSIVAEGGERWLVAISGGKDSYGMLALLLDLKWRGLLPVELIACNLDQGQPNFPKHILPDWLNQHGIAHRIEYQDTYSIVTDVIERRLNFREALARFRELPDIDEFLTRPREPGAGESLSDDNLLRQNLLGRLRGRLEEGSAEDRALLRRLEAEANVPGQ